MKKILRLSAVLFAALLLLSLFALPTGAKAETKYVEWKLSPDLETLTADGTVTYTYYGSEYDSDLFGSVIAYKEEIFHENKVEDPSGSSYRVYTVGENAIALTVKSRRARSSRMFFVNSTESGRRPSV